MTQPICMPRLLMRYLRKVHHLSYIPPTHLCM